MRTLIDFVISKNPTDGFDMLIERGMPELTGEAVVLRHAAHFDGAVAAAAQARLIDAGINIGMLRA
jgi:hypothetical protein